MKAVKSWIKNSFKNLPNKKLSRRQDFSKLGPKNGLAHQLLPFEGNYDKIIVQNSHNSEIILDLSFDFKVDEADKESL